MLLTNIMKFFLFLFLLIFTYSCTDIKKGLGIEKDVPDEFLVKREKNIKMPPDYKLPPPGSKINNVNNEKKVSSLKSEIDKTLNQQEKIEDKIDTDKITNVEIDILKKIKND